MNTISATRFALVCVALIAAPSGGAVVIFDNTARLFELVANGGGLTPLGHFDPTRGPLDQADLAPARSLEYAYREGGGSDTPRTDSYSCGLDIQVLASETPLVVTNSSGTTFQFVVAASLAAGAQVGESQDFRSSVGAALFWPRANRVHDPLLGSQATLGFRVQLPDGPHFGFIELEFGTGPLFGNADRFRMYEPIRWAYETTPNVPITVPATGPAASVLLASVAWVARRRRGS